MAGDGRPEAAAKRFGATIAQLRTRRGWSRARLITRLYSVMDENDDFGDDFGEAKLARLENGRAVKISRKLVEKLCQALKCTDMERASVLLAADRNVFTGDALEARPEAEVLNYVALCLRQEATSILAGLVGERDYADLTVEEVSELATRALKLVLRRLDRQS